MKFGINNPAWLQSAGNIGSGSANPFYIQAIEDETTVSVLDLIASATKVSFDGISYVPYTESITINSNEKLFFNVSQELTIVEPISLPAFSADKPFNIGGESPLVTYKPNEDPDDVHRMFLLPFHGSLVQDASRFTLPDDMTNIVSLMMFGGCHLLESAPILPATKLSDMCYTLMFSSCENLRTAPELPATELKEACYIGMFANCKSLTESPILPAVDLATNCYGGMDMGPLGDGGMFSGCTSLSRVTCLAGNISDEFTSNWLSNVAAQGTFVKAPGVEWPTGDSGIPDGWTVEEYAG